MLKRIKSYLQAAFQKADAFSIPAIGTFRKVHIPARLDESIGEIRPPEIQLQFIQQVDPEIPLRRFLEIHENLSPEDANTLEKDIQREIEQALEEKHVYLIPSIGKLQRDTSNRIVFAFTHKKELEMTGSFFGLQPVQYGQHTTAPPQNEPILATTVVAPTQQNLKKKPMFASFNWKTLAFVLFFITLGVFIIVNSSKLGTSRTHTHAEHDDSSDGASHEAASDATDRSLDETTEGNDKPGEEVGDLSALVVNPDELDDNKGRQEKTTTKPSSSREVENPLTVHTNPTPNTDKEESVLIPSNRNPRPNTRIVPPVTRREGSDIAVLDTGTVKSRTAEELLGEVQYFHLIMGSFQTLEAANELVDKLRAKGEDPIILFPNVGSSLSYRVSVFRNKTKKRVIDYNAMRKKQGKKTGWVFAQRKN